MWFPSEILFQHYENTLAVLHFASDFLKFLSPFFLVLLICGLLGFLLTNNNSKSHFLNENKNDHGFFASLGANRRRSYFHSENEI